MRLSVSLILILSVSARLAFAGADWSFNQIVGYVDLAERRLKEGDAVSARANLQSARDMMPEASAAAKADKGWPALEGRMTKLDKVLVGEEAGASKTQGANDKLRQADSDEIQARIAAQSDDYEKAAEYYDKCSKGLAQALAIDPSISGRTGSTSATHAEQVTKCKDGKAAMVKRMSGAGAGAAETEQGKAALEGFALASKAAGSKKVTTLELAAGLKGADACKNNAGYLTSLYNRNNKKIYEGATTKLGDLTIDEVNAKCTKLEAELKAKPAFGCGRHFVDGSQDRASIYDHWNRVEATRKLPFEAMDCSEMPKHSSFPGASASFKSMYVRSCGADAVYVIQHNRWLESPLQRQMSGDCWKKGSMMINR